MGFQLKCPLPGCGFETSANNMEDLMKAVTDHAKQGHNMTSIPPDVLAKVQAAIKPKFP